MQTAITEQPSAAEASRPLLLVLPADADDAEEVKLDRMLADFIRRPLTPERPSAQPARSVVEALRRGFSDLMIEKQDGTHEVLALLRRHVDSGSDLRAVS